MDDPDRQILALLVQDGRRTYDDIGRHVALSAPAVKRRVDKLRKQGALRGFTAVIDDSALGDRTEALVELFFAPGTPLPQVPRTLEAHPEAVEARSVTADAVAIARIRTRYHAAFQPPTSDLPRAGPAQRTPP